MSKIRLATLKKNGRRYFLPQIDFKRKRAYLWGEVSKCQGCRTWHEKTFSIPLNEITWEDVEKTDSLCRELFEQSIKSGVEDGFFKVIGENGRKHRHITIEKSNLHKLTPEIREWVLSGEISEKEGFELMNG